MTNSYFTRPLRLLMLAGISILLNISLMRAAAAAPLAILTDVHGTVQIVRGKKTTAAKNGDALNANDLVRVVNGAATIYYVTRAPQTLQSKMQARISATQAAGNNASPTLWKNVYTGVSSGFSRRAVKLPATVRNSNKWSLLLPVRSQVLSARPVFLWTKYADATDYIFTLKDAAGEVLYTTTTAKTSITDLETAPALQAGQKYLWEVAPRVLNARGEVEIAEEDAAPPVSFTIATPETTNAIKAELARLETELKNLPQAARSTAIASALVQRGFYGEALATLLPATLAVAKLENGEPWNAWKTEVPTLPVSSRWLLRSIYMDTQQHALVREMDALLPS